MRSWDTSARLTVLFVGFGLWAMIIGLRLVQVQVVHREYWAQMAIRQHRTRVSIQINRGVITDRHGVPLVLNQHAYSLFIRPFEIEDWSRTLARLQRYVSFSIQDVRARAEKSPAFVWIARKRLNDALARGIVREQLPGVYVVAEEARVYPQGALAGSVLGFVGIDNQGLEGIEYAYDAILHGETVSLTLGRDGRQRLFWYRPHLVDARPQTVRLELALDASIQYMTEKLLLQWVRDTRARRGLVVVMDPVTGEILVHAQYPPFEPARYRAYLRDPFAVGFLSGRWVFEPGSTFKPVVALAALMEHPSIRIQWFDGEGGEIRLHGITIRDHRPFGRLRFDEVLIYSSNVGMIKIAQTLSPNRLYAYLLAWGFGRKTGVDIPGERSGLLRSPAQWSPITPAYLSFGQGIGVTPLQLIRFYAMLANGGYGVTPRFARRFIDARGKVRLLLRPLGPKVIPSRWTRVMTSILERAVQHGTGRLARISGVRVAGKTGTAQKIGPSGTYEGYIASFVGYFPVESPRFVVLVLLDEPSRRPSGGEVAAPFFRAVAQILLDRWRYPLPSEPRVDPAPIRPVALATPSEVQQWPDWTGRPVLELIAWSQRLGLSVTIVGKGTVIKKQMPYPGTSLQVRHGVVWVGSPPREGGSDEQTGRAVSIAYRGTPPHPP